MNISELHRLPNSEKLKIIEALWQDLTEDETDASFFWHEAELKKTEADFLTNSVEVIDWQQAKKELRAQFE